MSRKIEDIKNIHYNNKNEIQFEYGGQIHHYSMNSLKEVFINYWNLLDSLDELEEWAKENFKDTYYVSNGIVYEEIINKIKELKGGEISERN